MGLFNIFKQSQDSLSNGKVRDNRKAECPYCKGVLLKVPARKTKCPHCSKFMFVRTHPKKLTRIVVTEKQARGIDNEWLMQQTANDPSFGGEKEFYKEKTILQKRFGKEPSIGDIKWGLLNKRACEAMKESDFSALSGIYFQMARQKHEKGKNCQIEQVEAQKMQLLALKQDGVDRVKILSKDGCKECKKLNGKTFSIDEAIKINPLPVATCTHKLNKNAPNGWCRCDFLPALDSKNFQGKEKPWLG